MRLCACGRGPGVTERLDLARAHAPPSLAPAPQSLTLDPRQPARPRPPLSTSYPLLTGLIGCGSVEIRGRVRNVFDVRLRGFLPF